MKEGEQQEPHRAGSPAGLGSGFWAGCSGPGSLLHPELSSGSPSPPSAPAPGSRAPPPSVCTPPPSSSSAPPAKRGSVSLADRRRWSHDRGRGLLLAGAALTCEGLQGGPHLPPLLLQLAQLGPDLLPTPHQHLLLGLQPPGIRLHTVFPILALLRICSRRSRRRRSRRSRRRVSWLSDSGATSQLTYRSGSSRWPCPFSPASSHPPSVSMAAHWSSPLIPSTDWKMKVEDQKLRAGGGGHSRKAPPS